MDKFQQYSEALTELIKEAIHCSPESWQRGVLTIDCDGVRINYKLKNASSQDTASISADLARLCDQYWGVFQDHGEGWNESIIEFYQADGEWKFNASYKRPPTPEVKTETKPFWKFWH